jgi:curved DNA-binding protein CbpA
MARADSQNTGSARGAAPQLVLGVNIRELPIGPEEAFVLSRIDGLSSEAEIAFMTNLPLGDIERMLARLVRLGAVVLGAPRAAADVARPFRPAATQSGAYRIGPIVESGGQRMSPHPAAAEDDASPSEEAVDLDPEQKQHLLALHEQLDASNHYQLLGVEPGADAKAIRSAYYELVRVFHPDRFFGKRLGSYKPKLGKVFGRLTEAYEALQRSESRAEYDSYLEARRRTLDFERDFFDTSRQAAEVASAMQRIEQAAREELLNAHAQSSLPSAAGAPSSGASTSRHSGLPPSDEAARRSLVGPTAASVVGSAASVVGSAARVDDAACRGRARSGRAQAPLRESARAGASGAAQSLRAAVRRRGRAQRPGGGCQCASYRLFFGARRRGARRAARRARTPCGSRTVGGLRRTR